MTPPSPFSDQEDLGQHLNFTTIPAEAVDELQLHLDAAVEAVEGWQATGRAPVGPLVTRPITERVTVGCGGRFTVSHTPLQTIVEAKLARDDTMIVDTGFDDFDGNSGIVHRSDLTPGDWNVTYEAGRGTPSQVPSSLKLAVLIVAGHIWEIQRGPRTRTFFGQASTDEATGHKGGAGYLIPNRAAHLMQPFSGVLIG